MVPGPPMVGPVLGIAGPLSPQSRVRGGFSARALNLKKEGSAREWPVVPQQTTPSPTRNRIPRPRSLSVLAPSPSRASSAANAVGMGKIFIPRLSGVSSPPRWSQARTAFPGRPGQRSPGYVPWARVRSFHWISAAAVPPGRQHGPGVGPPRGRFPWGPNCNRPPEAQRRAINRPLNGFEMPASGKKPMPHCPPRGKTGSRPASAPGTV